VWPSFMSAARTWSASGPTFDAGNAGRGSGLGGLIADLAERALVRVERLLVCVEWPHWPLPARLLAFAERGQRQADRTGDSGLHR
jgi:hypothetical protein